MLMGFTETEARLGLRACHGDSTLAVDYITQRRQVKNAFLLARHAIFPYEKERVQSLRTFRGRLLDSVQRSSFLARGKSRHLHNG